MRYATSHLGFVAACALAGALAAPMSMLLMPASAVIAASAAVAGLYLRRWAKLDDALRPRTRSREGRSVGTVRAVAAGLVLGLFTLGVVRLVLEPWVPAAGVRIAIAASQPAWRRLVIIYTAAVGEEVLFRLVGVSAMIGVLSRLASRGLALPSRRMIGLALVLSALVFGAAHLPAWLNAGAITLPLGALIIALNAAGGLVFGYIFVTRGIAAAIYTHAAADFVLLFVGPRT